MKALQMFRPAALVLASIGIAVLTSFSPPIARAASSAGPGGPSAKPSAMCTWVSAVTAATNEYRWAYDAGYRSAQRVAAATNEYRWAYDQRFIAEQRVAAVTNRYQGQYGGSSMICVR